MTKYKIEVERRVTRKILLRYEVETQEAADVLRHAVRNGEIDAYAAPAMEEPGETETVDKLLIITKA